MWKIVIAILLFVNIYGQKSPDFVFEELQKCWQQENTSELELLFTSQVRIFLNKNGGEYSRSKILDILKEHFETVDIIVFLNNKKKTTKQRIVVDYKYKKKSTIITSRLYFFMSYNTWNDIYLVESIREITQIVDDKKANEVTETGYSKELLIEKRGDPQIMNSEFWEYTRILSMGCHNAFYVTKYFFSKGRVVDIKKKEISTGCGAESLW
ncbi:hypothetical protein [Candidatus Uabimicrobium sp. HlEnr_7]|uniref:hypothetical protein n=1 Tax=Candidatus Uabimicrobium helgolandensis TaxID=3095367 RepID=UPI003556EC6E